MNNQNFELYAGDSKRINVTVTNHIGAAVSLSSATIKWAMKRTVDAAADISKNTTSGITITDAAAGIFQITLLPADTTGKSGEYYHEAEVTDSLGNVSTVLTGKVTIRASGI